MSTLQPPEQQALADAAVPARRSNLKADIADYLREQIFLGRLRPNTRLDQDALAERLGVSKLPVREALITLETEGLVVASPRRSTYVAPLTEGDIRDQFRIFGAVSALVAEEAATVLTSGEIDALDATVAGMRAGGDFEKMRRLNDDFHRGINRAGSRRMQSVLRQLAMTMPTRFYEFTQDWEESAHAEHQEIVDSLRSRDAAQAAARTQSHFQRNGELAVQILRRKGFWEQPEQ